MTYNLETQAVREAHQLDLYHLRQSNPANIKQFSITISKCTPTIRTLVCQSLILRAETTSSSSRFWSGQLITVPRNGTVVMVLHKAAGDLLVCQLLHLRTREPWWVRHPFALYIDIISSEFMMWELLHWQEM